MTIFHPCMPSGCRLSGMTVAAGLERMRRKPKAEVFAIWKRTRQAVPADLQRYAAAVAALSGFSGACSAVSAAAASEPEVAEACKRRAQVMAGTLAAARAAMGDWRSHQAAMAHKAARTEGAAGNRQPLHGREDVHRPRSSTGRRTADEQQTIA
jgi:hypothetical protein